jgi:molybdate transport system ATP-binding protein
MALLSFQCGHEYADGFALDAALEAGEGVTALLGPSGSGKTTILMLIAGLLRPRPGRIQLGEQVLVDTEKGICVPPEEHGVGVVFQEHRLFPHLSVERNLCYGQARRPARQIDFADVVQTLELGDLLRRYPATLSGGQRQRVALGRALLRGPELLLLDEPLVALERDLQDRIVVYLERVLKTFRIPTLLVSHDEQMAQRLAQQVVRIEQGRVVHTTVNDQTVPDASLNAPQNESQHPSPDKVPQGGAP